MHNGIIDNWNVAKKCSFHQILQFLVKLNLRFFFLQSIKLLQHGVLAPTDSTIKLWIFMNSGRKLGWAFNPKSHFEKSRVWIGLRFSFTLTCGSHALRGSSPCKLLPDGHTYNPSKPISKTAAKQGSIGHALLTPSFSWSKEVAELQGTCWAAFNGSFLVTSITTNYTHPCFSFLFVNHAKPQRRSENNENDKIASSSLQQSTWAETKTTHLL